MRADVGHCSQPDDERIGRQNHRCSGFRGVRMRLQDWCADDNNGDGVAPWLTAFDVGAIVRHI